MEESAESPASARPVVRRSVASVPRPRAKPGLKQRLAAPMRWLHIYSSMFGLVAILFFSVTGLTLNHPSWTLGAVAREESAKGVMPVAWLGSGEQAPAKLEVAEYLRKQHRLRGFVADFTADDSECMVTFKGPGYTADAFIDRETGSYEITQQSAGLTALMNDLHKGRDTGPVWKWVIDLSAGLLIIVSLTGIALLLYIKRRRRNGLLATLGGFALLLLIGWLCVP